MTNQQTNALQSTDLNNKTVLLRLDLNVPVQDGVVTDFTRIDRAKPAIDLLRQKGAKIIILSHYGRPKGKPNPEFSLSFLPPVLSQRWGTPVSFDDTNTPITLLENLRFNAGEEADDMAFAQSLAKLGDVYVNDAFSVSHRAHASVHALATLLPAYAGPAMQAELSALCAAIGSPARPVAAIVGGAKISTKLDLLTNLVEKMDVLVLGGGMANTFLAARGWNAQKSLVEADMLQTARDISAKAAESGCQIILPVDGVMAQTYAQDAAHKTLPIDQIPQDWLMLDAGPETVTLIEEALDSCQTIVWNGPLGVFEWDAFANGTVSLARWVAAQNKTCVAGGGDTVSALSKAGVTDKLTYISTAGGAFLEWLEGKDLPGVTILAKTDKAA